MPYLKKEDLIKNKREYYLKHRQEILLKRKIYRDKTRYNIDYYWRNRDDCLKNNKLWRKTHKEELREYYRKKMKILNNRILHCLRTRINMSIKRNSKSESTIELLGCSVEFLKQHLESKFKSGMSWDNYGKWHIDHIIPCASFDLSKPNEQRKCFNYTNLQPLWAIENIIKSNKIYS
jgi:hypothetical protein